MNVYEKLNMIQSTISVAKNQKNSFGNYNYRSCEDILQALQPMVKDLKVVILLEDDIRELLSVGQLCVEATATIIDCESAEKISVKAYAGIDTNKKGMDASQCYGASSSYARKYALNGLLKLDDNKDADTDAFAKMMNQGKAENQEKNEKVVNSTTQVQKPQKTAKKNVVEPNTQEKLDNEHEMIETLDKLRDSICKICNEKGRDVLKMVEYYSRKYATDFNEMDFETLIDIKQEVEKMASK